MGARSGSNYLSALKKRNAEIWLGGEHVGEVTSNPAFRDCARSIASLYDMQLERVEQMTFRTDDGGRSGLSFIQPNSIEELRKRSRMMAAWANFSGGMLVQTPDHSNVALAAMAAARDFFAASDPRFGDNIANYYLEARKHDWCSAVALNDTLGVPLMDETSAGLIVTRMMRALLAPLAEELLVLPPPELSNDASSQPLAIAFAISSNTKGVKLVHGGVVDVPRSRFDAPLTSRFTQFNCLIFFNHVMVPWERVFLCGDLVRCNALLDETNARVHMIHQTVVKTVAKAEFMLGIAARLAEVTRTDVSDRIAEMSAVVATLRACLQSAESNAAADKWGITVASREPLDTACTLFAQQFPRMVETIQLIGGSDLAMQPADRERAALYRLAWDATGSTFAKNQFEFERAILGDSSRMANDSLDATDLTPLTQRIKDFLARTD